MRFRCFIPVESSRPSVRLRVQLHGETPSTTTIVVAPRTPSTTTHDDAPSTSTHDPRTSTTRVQLPSPRPGSTSTTPVKYYYKPREFGCIKSPRRPVFRQVRLPVSSSTTTAGDLGHAKYPFELSIPQAPSSTTTQVPRERLYLYRRRGSDKYPYNKCTSTVVFGIAKNVKHPFEMTRPTSSNDPKYLSENETYTATVARIETDKSEDASTTPNHVRRPSPKTRVTQASSSTAIT